MRYRRGKKFHPSIGSEFEREKREKKRKGGSLVGSGHFGSSSFSLSSFFFFFPQFMWRMGWVGGRRKMGSSEVGGNDLFGWPKPSPLGREKRKKRQAATAECG